MAYWVLCMLDVVVIQLATTTFDSGDSILHYLQAKQAFRYPHYYMDHWSKPLFVLLASPFAVFGFAGMKLFNTLCMLGSLWWAYKIADKYSAHAWLILLTGLLVPELFLSQASGLTEPLFALLLTMAVYLFINGQVTASLLLISFLPFVRSEGWLIMPVFALGAIMLGQYQKILFLMVGHLAYGVAGLFVYDDFFWMFHQNPYQGVETKYGSGNLTHFLNQSPYLLGWPQTIISFLGILYLAYNVLIKRIKAYFTFAILVLGSVLVFYIAHSLFWYYGLFHSFGLKRVFIAIIPLMLVAGIFFFTWLNLLIKSSRNFKMLFTAVVMIMLVFPFSNNKTGLGLPESVLLSKNQQLVNEAADWFKNQHTGKKPVSFGNYYFAEVLSTDIDDKNDYLNIGLANKNYLPRGTTVFWDSYFSVTDQGVSKQAIEQGGYKRLKEFKNNLGYEIVIYEKE